MTTLTIKIDLDGEAFENGRDWELEQMFYKIRSEISMLEESGTLRDSNGNRVGEWAIHRLGKTKGVRFTQDDKGQSLLRSNRKGEW